LSKLFWSALNAALESGASNGSPGFQQPIERCLWNQYALPDSDRWDVSPFGRVISLVSADAEEPTSFFDIVSLPIV